ncbi:YceI family protein [Duganella flavida]|nr:YceI family protein [Duganella flavida]
MKKILLISTLATLANLAQAQNYNLDPSHTYPSFEADHMGLSKWSGKFTRTSGTVVLDHNAKTGALDVKIDATSVDFGNAALDQHVRSADFLNVEKFPVITYKSRAIHFAGNKPASADGDLTMMGVTKPVHLTINNFNCLIHPRLKREICGAEVVGEFQRSDFGMNFGLPTFSPTIKLSVQVEAIKAE